MRGRKKLEQGRVLGPYKEGPRKWRIVIFDGAGDQSSETAPTEEEAKELKKKAERDLEKMLIQEKTIGDAIDEYQKHLLRKGNKQSGVDTTGYQLRSFVEKRVNDPLRWLTKAKCQQLYDKLTERLTYRGTKTSVDTHRNTLSQVKTWLSWCADQKYLRSNPALDIEGVGARADGGKPQLRLDESLRWLDVAMERADEGRLTATAALLALGLGVRISELLHRVARDVDAGGSLLWIEKHTKNKKSKRRLGVAEYLRPYLLELAKGKEPEQKLFPGVRRESVRKQVISICKAAGVVKVTTHSLRGTHASLAEENGASSDAVAKAFGHTQTRTTHKHYTKKDVVDNVRQRRFWKVIAGENTGQNESKIGERNS